MKLGIVYHFTSTRQLVGAVGPAWAKQILFTGDILDADTSLLIGLVTFTVLITWQRGSAIVSHAETRRCLILLGEMISMPGLVDRLSETLVPEERS